MKAWAKDLEDVFAIYEPLYSTQDEVPSGEAPPNENPFKSRPSPSGLESRYQAFMTFVRRVLDEGELPARSNFKEADILRDLTTVTDRVGWIVRLKKDGTIPSEAPKLRERLELEPGEFFLEHVPEWMELPSQTTLTDKGEEGFKFDSGWWDEYRETRPLRDFDLMEADLMSIGMDDPHERQALLASFEQRDSLKPAKIFDIGDVIREKKEQDPSHEDFLSTKELLEAIDAAGYRPATILELMAYARDRWKPEPEETRGQPLTKEESEERCNAPYIYAFASPFADSGDIRRVPCLDWSGSERLLGAGDFADGWDSGHRFLVLRK